MRIAYLIFIAVIFTSQGALAASRSYQGCCSGHGGVSFNVLEPYCRNGHVVCKDGTLSPDCGCDGDSSGYSPSYLYRANVPPYDLIQYVFREVKRSGDWIVARITSHGDSLGIRTDTPAQSFTIRYSPINQYAGATIRSRRGKEYYIQYDVRFDLYPNVGKILGISYSFDRTGRFTRAHILFSQLYGNMGIVYFQPQDAAEFERECRKNHLIAFRITTSKGETSAEFSLHGFTSMHNDVYSMLK